MVRICVSLPATTTEESIEAILGLDEPNLIEIRLDYASESLDLERIKEATRTPLIATARLPSQGGRWRVGEGERKRILLCAASAGFDYIDVDEDSASLSKLVARLHDKRASVIVSRHFTDMTPPVGELLSIHREAKAVGADIVKIVGTANCPSDNLPYLEYLAQEPGNVSFAMGALGIPSRIMSPLIGGAFTYASAGEYAAVAPGQPTLRLLRETYRLMGVEV